MATSKAQWHSEPTYEGSKPAQPDYFAGTDEHSEPTYEGSKRCRRLRVLQVLRDSEPTYEGSKLASADEYERRMVIRSLPMRDRNAERLSRDQDYEEDSEPTYEGSKQSPLADGGPWQFEFGAYL